MPLRVYIIEVQVRTAIRVLGTIATLHGPAHAQESPWVLFEVFDLEVFVSWSFENLLDWIQRVSVSS